MCEVLNIKRNVYNYWLRTKEERTKRQKKEKELLEEIVAEHKKRQRDFRGKKDLSAFVKKKGRMQLLQGFEAEKSERNLF